MTALAPSAIGPVQKLAAVRVWLVAIRTLVVGEWHLEIRTSVAGQAGNLKVLAQERIVCLRVIEGR
jgi:hypothetical protein